MQISELMKRVAQGDKDSYRQIYQITCCKVKAIAINILKVPDFTKDVLHETYTTVWVNSSKFKVNKDDEQWILKIARKSATALYKKKKHTKEYKEKLITAQKNNELAKLIDTDSLIMQVLDKEEKEIFLLKMAGHSDQEIADKLKCGSDKVNEIFKKAKAKLENYLKENKNN